jgi:glutathione synthase
MTLSELSTNARVVPIDGADVGQHTSLPSQRQLLVRLNTSKEEYKVSVVYYRSGYSPNDYPSEIEWGVRVMIENSRAIKCPSIGYQLAGTKAIQAALYLPNVLEKYLTKDDSIKIRQCFAAQYSMIDFRNGDEVTKIAVENAICDGTNWVLKPQREGGGNNFYGQDLSDFLKSNYNDPVLQGMYELDIHGNI